jgi:hypothetical protein
MSLHTGEESEKVQLLMQGRIADYRMLFYAVCG